VIDAAVFSVSSLADRIAGPLGLGEPEDIAAGGVAAVVDLTDAPSRPPPEALFDAVRTIPGVIVGLMPQDPPEGANGWAQLADVLVDHSQLEAVVVAARAKPRAAAALTLLLRRPAGDGAADGLVAESAVYSMLQAGPEFALWRAGRPPPRPTPRTGDAPPVRVRRDDDQLTVTLSRPSVHNALDTAMRDALVDALAVAVADPSVRVVLDGAGPSFCSGGDLNEFGTTPDPVTAHLIRLTRSPARVLAQLSPRVVARVHGACIGAGVELAAFAGRVISRPDAFFALPELALGLIPGAGGTVSLPRRIGRHRTAWMALTGERLSAEQARSWGLVDEIEP
jgi:hypothetical protein